MHRIISLPIKVVACAVVDDVLVVLHPQKVFAIIAAIVLELVEGFHQTARQARTQSSQILRNRIKGHGFSGFKDITASENVLVF